MQRLAVFLISTTLVLLLAGSALATIDSPRPIVAQPYQASSAPIELPDVIVSVRSATTELQRSQLVRDLMDLPAVEGASTILPTDAASDGAVAVLVVLSDEATQQDIEAISATVYQRLGDARVSIGGRAVADRALLDRINRGTIIALAPVVLLVAVLIAAALGLMTGLSVGAAIGLSALLGSLVASRSVGEFDGTISTTAVPAALVAVLVSSVLAFRLLEWFKYPQGEDPAASIRMSVRHLAPEVALMIGGLFVAAAVLAVLGSSPRSTLVVAVSALVSAVVTLATLPAMLASADPVVDTDDYRMFRMDLPDGRDFPLAMLAAFACFLLGFGLFAVRASDDALLDESAMSSGASARRSLDIDALAGADPTSAVLAVLPSDASESDRLDWATAASSNDSIAYVDTEAGRFVDGVIGDSATTVTGHNRAFVVVDAPARSVLAQEAVAALGAIETFSGEVELSGTPVQAAATTDGALTALWLLVGLLSLAGAAAILLISGNLWLSAVGFFTRVLGSAAIIGVYFLVASSPTAFELQVAALIAGAGVGLFEIALIRSLSVSSRLGQDPSEALTSAMRIEGKAAVLGLGVTALSGVGFLTSDLEVARRLGVALAAGLVIEMILGVWLLRPVLLGETLLRSDPRVRVPSIRPAAAPALPSTLPDFSWRRAVSSLLRIEFAFQQDPDHAQLAEVFVEGTAVFGELSEHNALLRANGLKVVGRGPKLLKVSVVESGSPVCLAVTVDHPPRQLVDHHGRLVGERTAERRDGMLWLVKSPSGRYRIVEAVDLGVNAEIGSEHPSPVPVGAIT